MAFQQTSFAWGALCLELVALLGCNKGNEHFGPPQPFVTGGPGGGAAGGGGAGGSTSASGGTGGGTTTIQSPPNFCECVYSSTFDAECGACVNDVIIADCKDKEMPCELDGECKGLLDCPKACIGKPESEQVACVQACLVPFPDSAAGPLYANLLECVCGTCQAKCGTAKPISCE
jgi:hypothetical protein